MQEKSYDGFLCHELDAEHLFYAGRLPDDMRLDRMTFECLWAMHPIEYHEIMMHGRLVKTPRWQQAYGMDYHYTNRTNAALPMIPPFTPFLKWSQMVIEPQLNGILVNWYDGHLGHYIGPHRDSTTNMVQDAPIVTISFGQRRLFRLRPWNGKGYRDFAADDGTVFIMPYETNRAWTHEVPHAARFGGRRISITIRAFLERSVENV
jgi:alkylated DNA repair dioxygenase AlkB